MRAGTTNKTAEAVRAEAIELTGGARDYDAVVDLAREARVVLIGEASHGTHDFYRERARITRRLIDEAGFAGVAVEADWPDAYRINRYVRGMSDDSAEAALDDFRRFPQWMWRNQDVLEFIAWLRERNADVTPGESSTGMAGFYGLDLYSLYASIDAVLAYLDSVDPDAARRARGRYACFEHFDQNSQAYGYAATHGAAEPCEAKAVEQLVELRRAAAQYRGRGEPDDFFYAEQNARLVQNAEEYYRSMFRGRTSSWNLRDGHMAETLDALIAHLSAPGRRARLVVWAHNSHLGDARATEMGSRGELNLGQLVRERYDRDAALIGFSTYHGTVTAASDWDQPAEQKRVRPGLPGSYEEVFHDVAIPSFMVNLQRRGASVRALADPRLQRAIGVIYRPETERWSHYFESILPHQFDMMLHFDRTEALVPMEQSASWKTVEPEETYPTGL